MKRLNPLGTLLGIILTILLFMGLGLSLWLNQGLAFNPGPVTGITKVGVKIQGYASHADFEKQCSTCHEPFKMRLADRCTSCHNDVTQQIQAGEGVHSLISKSSNCNSCHLEHKGRTYNPTLAAYRLFDHSRTDFSLNWHQQNFDTSPMQCSECHGKESFSSVENKTCLECHQSQDRKFSAAHVTDYGADCQTCHNGVDRMDHFNHNQVDFPLDGQHTQLKCRDCHTSANLKDASSDCAGCHNEPAIHLGLSNQACSSCHTTASWSPALLDKQEFSHSRTTRFSLALHKVDYSQQAITCFTCHPQNLLSLSNQSCIDCHAQDDPKWKPDHPEQYGSDCLVCHDGVDRLSQFDHVNFFPLDGKHATVECTDCHANQIYRGTPSECSQCHKEPEIHAGVFGLKCEYCHGVVAWSPANLQQHTFPLDHGSDGQALPCDTCHGSNYYEYTCYNCHTHQQDQIIKTHKAANIQEKDLEACVNCHPSGAADKSGQ